MALPNVPPDVIKVLSFHGLVEVFAEGPAPRPVERVGCAPFDDQVVLFLRPGGAVEEALRWSTRLDVQARHKDGDYSLRMVGRAHPGVRLTRERDRHAMEPWLPDGVLPGSVLATHFVPEHIEFVRTEAGEKVRYHGPTAAGQAAPGEVARWLRAASSGSAAIAVFSSIVLPFLYLGYQGSEYLGRPLATILAVGGALSLAFGTRLVLLHYAYEQWRAGKVAIAESSWVGDGLLASRQCVSVGLGALGIGLLATLVAKVLWDDELALVVFGSSLAWILGPASAIHLFTATAGSETTD